MLNLMPRYGVICALSAVLLLLETGCVSRSEYDAKVAELKSQSDKLSQAEQATKDAQTKIKKLEEVKNDLQNQNEKQSQLEKQIVQLQKDLATARTEAAAQRKKLEDENADLQKKHVNLVQALHSIEQQVNQARDFQAAAKETLQKLKREAHARIKALEEENAKLKKTASEAKALAR